MFRGPCGTGALFSKHAAVTITHTPHHGIIQHGLLRAQTCWSGSLYFRLHLRGCQIGTDRFLYKHFFLMLSSFFFLLAVQGVFFPHVLCFVILSLCLIWVNENQACLIQTAIGPNKMLVRLSSRLWCVDGERLVLKIILNHLDKSRCIDHQLSPSPRQFQKNSISAKSHKPA